MYFRGVVQYRTILSALFDLILDPSILYSNLLCMFIVINIVDSILRQMLSSVYILHGASQSAKTGFRGLCKVMWIVESHMIQ